MTALEQGALRAHEAQRVADVADGVVCALPIGVPAFLCGVPWGRERRQVLP